MIENLNDILLLALIGGLVSLDVSVLGQWMVSSPLVTGVIMGTLLNNTWAGFKVGVIVELLFIDVIPVGVAIPLNTSVVAVLATAWYLLSNSVSMSALVLALAIAIPMGMVFKWIDITMRRRNVFMIHLVDSWVQKGKENRIQLLIYTGIILNFLRSFIFYCLVIIPGYYCIIYLLGHLPARILQGLRLASEVLPLLGLVIAIKSIRFNPIETLGITRKTEQETCR